MTGRKWSSPTKGAYASWRAMRSRCLNPSDPAYKKYGGVGVSICAEWVDDFDRFYRDMGERPEGMTLDRVNNAHGYSPTNCRWATRKEQVKNRAYTVIVTYQGQTKTLAEWADCLGVPYYMLWNRIRGQKMLPEKALTADRFVAKQWAHGSITGYHRGCRCELCKRASQEAQSRYKRKKLYGGQT